MRWFNIAKLAFIILSTVNLVAWILGLGGVLGGIRISMVIVAGYLFLPEAFVFFFHRKEKLTLLKTLDKMYWSIGEYNPNLPAMRVDLKKTTIQILMAVGGFVLAFLSGRTPTASPVIFISVITSVILGISYAFVLDGGIQKDTTIGDGSRLITVPSAYQKVLEILLSLQVATLLFGLISLIQPSAQQLPLTREQLRSYLATGVTASDTGWAQDGVAFPRPGGIDVYIRVRNVADVLIKKGDKILVQSRLGFRREVQEQLTVLDQLSKLMKDEIATIERVPMNPEIEGYQKGLLLELYSRLSEIENRRRIIESRLYITSPVGGTVVDIGPVLSTANSVYVKVVFQP